MTEYTRRAIHGSLIVFIFSLVSAVFGYLFRLILSRELSISDFGLFFALVAFFTLIVNIADFGVGSAVYYFIPRMLVKNDRKRLKGIISKVLCFRTIMLSIALILIALISKFLASEYFKAGSWTIVCVFGLAFTINTIEGLFQTLFNAFQKNFLFSFQNLVRTIILLTIALIALKISNSIYSVIYATLIGYVLMLVIFSGVFYRKIFPDYFDVKAIKFKLIKLVKFGIPATLSSLSFILITSTDVLMLTFFASLSEVGLYNAALPIVNLVLYFPLAVAAIILPMSSELWESRKISTLNVAVEKITLYVFVILVPVIMALIAYPEVCLNILFGPSFISASGALRILAIGCLFYGVAVISMHFLLGIAGPKINTVITLSAAVLNILLNLILVPVLGMNGAALATCITYIILFIASNIVLFRKLKLIIHYKKYFYALFNGIIFVVIISFLKGAIDMHVIAETLLILMITSSIYIIITFFFKIVRYKEVTEVIKQITLKSNNSKS